MLQRFLIAPIFLVALLLIALSSGMTQDIREPSAVTLSSGLEATARTDALFLDCRLLDSDGKAIAGAEVYDGPPFASVDSDALTRGLLCRSDANGRFRIERNVLLGQDISVFVVAKGKCVEQLSAVLIGRRPIDVRLSPEVCIDILVVDEQGIPMPNVKVRPKGMRFVDDLTIEVATCLQSTTDNLGRGVVQGSRVGNRNGDLQAIELESMDGRTLRFQLPSSMDPAKPTTIRWVSSRGTFRCRVVDAAGAPIPESLVIVESPNLFPDEKIRHPEISFHRTISTDANGECQVKDIPVPFIWAQCMNSGDPGYNTWVGPVKVVDSESVQVELKLLPTQKIKFSILDASDFLGHTNIKVTFAKAGKQAGIHGRYRTVRALGYTEGDGQGMVTLETGNWEASLSDLSSLPEGYILSTPLPIQKFEVASSNEPKSLVPFVIRKGRQIQGRIEGCNPLELQADWIHALLQDRLGEETLYAGKIQMDGKFAIAVPSECTDANIVGFQAAGYLARRGKGSLSIVSRSPWVLETVSKD